MVDHAQILKFLQKNLGRPYSYRFWKSAIEKGLGNLLSFPLRWDTNTDREGMFCTELLAHTLAAGGALDLSQRCAQSLLPHDFWTNSVPWTRGQTLTEPERLFGDVQTEARPNNDYLKLLFENKFKLWLEGM